MHLKFRNFSVVSSVQRMHGKLQTLICEKIQPEQRERGFQPRVQQHGDRETDYYQDIQKESHRSKLTRAAALCNPGIPSRT